MAISCYVVPKCVLFVAQTCTPYGAQSRRKAVIMEAHMQLRCGSAPSMLELVFAELQLRWSMHQRYGGRDLELRRHASPDACSFVVAERLSRLNRYRNTKINLARRPVSRPSAYPPTAFSTISTTEISANPSRTASTVPRSAQDIAPG